MTRRGDASPHVWAREMARYSFSDRRIQLDAEVLGHRAVRVSLTICLFDSVDGVGPPAGHPIGIFRQDVFDMAAAPPPKEALRMLWRKMFDHEFEEQLRRDEHQVYDPHGVRETTPSYLYPPNKEHEDEINRGDKREGLRRHEAGSLFRESETGRFDPRATDQSPSHAERDE